jgi:hypothetical protein
MYKQPKNIYTKRDFVSHLKDKKPTEEERKQEEEKKQIGRELIKQDVKRQFQANPKV